MTALIVNRAIRGVAILFLVSCSGEPEQAPVVMEATPALEATVEEALEAAGVGDEAESLINDRSIAVLAFADLSENSDQEYFSDGFSSDLINRLAMIPDLQVAGRKSSFYYKGRDAMPASIGDALQVERLLLGSVNKAGDNLQVTAQLISSNDGSAIWSRTYDRPLDDVIAIQTEIVSEVATALSVTMGNGEMTVPGMTRNIDAYDNALQARTLYNQFTPDNVLAAINLLEEAVTLDPEFGRGWLRLSVIYAQSHPDFTPGQALDFPAQAAEAFAQATDTAPDMPELMLVEAGSLRDAGRFLEAENLYQQYVDRYGYSAARALDEYAQMLARTGQFNEAIAMLKRARRVEPLAPRFTYQLALLRLYRGQDADVARLAEYGLGLAGGNYLFSSLAWELALRERDLQRAAALIRTFLDDHTEFSYDNTVSRSFLEKFAGLLSLNDFAASTDDIIAMINDPSVTPLELEYIARLVALMGQPGIALEYWFGQNASPAIWDDVYLDMRRLPDFNRLLQEKGLVDYWRATENWGEYCVKAGGQDFVCK